MGKHNERLSVINKRLKDRGKKPEVSVADSSPAVRRQVKLRTKARLSPQEEQSSRGGCLLSLGSYAMPGSGPWLGKMGTLR